MGSFEAWVFHLGLILHLNLQYPDLYLPLPTGILGFCCNIYTRIYLSTNWNFGALLQYLHPNLPLPTRNLGLCCNTYTCTYVYQLEFWGFVAILTLILSFTNQNFGVLLQYLHPYLLLPIGILGLNYNTCTCNYFYQLGFWAQLQYMHLPLILSLSFCFRISHFLCLLLGTIITFVPYQTSCVC